MFITPHKLGVTTCREVIENRIKQMLHNTSRPCYEIKKFAQNRLLKKFTKLTFVSNFTVNELFPITINWSNTKLLKAFSDDLAFFRHGLSVFTKLNLMLLISVNIRNRGNYHFYLSPKTSLKYLRSKIKFTPTSS